MSSLFWRQTHLNPFLSKEEAKRFLKTKRDTNKRDVFDGRGGPRKYRLRTLKMKTRTAVTQRGAYGDELVYLNAGTPIYIIEEYRG